MSRLPQHQHTCFASIPDDILTSNSITPAPNLLCGTALRNNNKGSTTNWHHVKTKCITWTAILKHSRFTSHRIANIVAIWWQSVSQNKCIVKNQVANQGQWCCCSDACLWDNTCPGPSCKATHQHCESQWQNRWQQTRQSSQSICWIAGPTTTWIESMVCVWGHVPHV